MNVKSMISALIVGGCAVAFVATSVGFAQAPAPAGGGTPQVGQAPGAPGAPAPGRGGRGGAGRAGGGGRAAGPQTQVAAPMDVAQMIAALPNIAPATPKSNRRVLVFSRAGGFVHSSIPIAARTIEALGATPVPGELPPGRANQAWTTVITYDVNDINAANLAQYDAVFLNNTTGTFLDDAADPAASEARRKALLDFVRGGKGLGGIHSATDSYHKGGSPLWQEFNHMIGGSFKFHWNYPTPITLKVDDVDNPINRSFTRVQGGNRVANNVMVVDEVYTFSQDSWSRDRVRTLLSVNYERMPQEIKDQEPANGKRTDGDYGISYIRREGQGRVYVNVLGHDHGIYKMPAMLQHFLAGMQYALGDLEGVDDSPMPLK